MRWFLIAPQKYSVLVRAMSDTGGQLLFDTGSARAIATECPVKIRGAAPEKKGSGIRAVRKRSRAKNDSARVGFSTHGAVPKPLTKRVIIEWIFPGIFPGL